MSRARILSVAALFAVLAIVSSVASAVGDDGFVSLFNGKDLTGWKWVVGGKDKDAGKVTFTVKDGVIVVSGRPNGYLYTEKSFKNYILKYDWKYPKSGNSGCFVHIQGEHKVWPKCVEVQGQQSDHGSMHPLGGAKGNFTKDKEAQKKAIKISDWNTTEVIVKGGDITTKVNGLQIATGSCDLTEGQIGFQSEGAEIHFKNIKIKEMK